jgi:hypothetical protein
MRKVQHGEKSFMNILDQTKQSLSQQVYSFAFSKPGISNSNVFRGLAGHKILQKRSLRVTLLFKSGKS